tara:strand:- start:2492 stop:2692 length:201 start_codon:yes stop_codon:yes gene_type:complete
MSKSNQYALESNIQDIEQQEELRELYLELERNAERKRIQDLQKACRGEFDIFAEIKKFNEAYKESL